MIAPASPLSRLMEITCHPLTVLSGLGNLSFQTHGAEPPASFLLSVIPSSHPHLNRENVLETKRAFWCFTTSEKGGKKKKKKKKKKKALHHTESVTTIKWALEYSEGIHVLDSSVLCRLQHTRQLVTASTTTTTMKPTASGSVTHPAQLLFTKAHALDSNH